MTRLEKEAPANSVPAAAVRRRGRVLFGMTGRKGYVGGLWWRYHKFQGLTLETGNEIVIWIE